MRSSVQRALLILSLLWFGILSGPLAAQSSNLSHQAWTTENGLPQNSVHAIFQSRDGYLWIATEGGVARSNAVEFKIFQHDNTPAITSDDICCFAQGSDDSTVWIGTADGIVRYSGGAFQHYGTQDGLPSSNVLSLASVNGSIFALTGDGLAHFDGNRFIAIPVSAPITAMQVSGDSLLIATTAGLFQYRANTLSSAYQQLMPSSQPVRAFGFLSDRSLWQRTATELTFHANGNTRTLGPSALNGAHIQSFLPSSQGGLWIGTNRGLYRLDDSISPPRLVQALDTHSILSLREDAEGDLWVGTESSGLHVLRHRNFHTLPGETESMVSSIAQTTDGAVWVGTNGEGLERWLAGNKHTVSTRDGLLSDIILSLAPGGTEDLWIGTPDGLNHLQDGHATSITSADGLPDDFIRSIYPDGDGTLWIGTRRGLAHLKNGKITTLTQADGLGSNLIGALVRPVGSDNLWIATLGGLSVLSGSGKIKTYTQNDGLSGNIITALFADTQGNLWIGTRGNGLSVRTADGRLLAIHRDDLPSTIDSIIGDTRGALWLGSPHGLLRVRLYELIACASSPSCTLHINRYGTSDGMPTEEVSAMGHPAAWRTAEGNLWFATRKGVAIVDPSNLFISRGPPPIVIERFTVDDVEQPGGVDISPGHTRFAFEYAALSFVAPSRVQYRYRLEGFDPHWIDAGSRRTAFYTNLPAGSYRFLVQAANNDGIWNERGAVLAFTVRPPFYRTLWFILLAIFLLALTVFFIYRLRLRRLRSQFNAVLAERNRVAREVHDTLAQSFVGVSVQLELTGQLLAHEKVDAARQQLDQTRAYVREGIEEARRSIWDLRAATAQNTLPTLLTRLSEKTQTLSLRIQVQIGGTYRSLAPSVENEIFRIAQEALNNITQHALASAATVSLNYEPSQLLLTIVDNGRGFTPTVKKQSSRGHFGIQGMRERAETIGASLSITSSPGHGTQVKLVVPL
ncbi:MAG TPA: two-component regulator propeller domain-containing protein [Edaphobacter sp.]|nr:two-component regulator propeller domain-containing protein [Edaphobacter sp.]